MLGKVRRLAGTFLMLTHSSLSWISPVSRANPYANLHHLIHTRRAPSVPECERIAARRRAHCVCYDRTSMRSSYRFCLRLLFADGRCPHGNAARPPKVRALHLSVVYAALHSAHAPANVTTRTHRRSGPAFVSSSRIRSRRDPCASISTSSSVSF